MLMKYLSIKRLTWLCIAALSTPVFTSCDMMTEDRDDCPMGLYLNFKYDYNLERADMFNDHVGAVDVYVFDETASMSHASRRPTWAARCRWPCLHTQ